MRVTGLDIDPRHATALLNAGLRDSQDLLLLSTPEVSRRASITATAARAAKGAAATVEYTSQAVTALDMLESPESGTHVLTTGCAILDGILRGGIRARGITEIVGESASAKTQLCLQLAVTVQLPVEAGGLAGSAVFICTEDAFPNKRMAQLAETAHERWPEMGDTRVSDKVYVEHCGTVAGLLTLLTQRVPVMVRQGVRLVIIDSIAALFRGEYGRDDAIARADELFKICRTLKVLSDEWHTPVICVNQVSDLVGGDGPRLVIPALGMAWSDMVNTRVFLQKAGGNKARTLSVVLASHLPPAQVGMEVNATGVHGLAHIGQVAL